MDERRIVYVSYIASHLAAVWDALTNPEVTQIYWYGTRVESDWKVGSKVLYMRNGEVTDEHILLAVDPPHSFRHSFHPVFAEEFRKEEPSRLTFALEESGDVVQTHAHPRRISLQQQGNRGRPRELAPHHQQPQDAARNREAAARD